jgi:hypothetical protein
MEADDGIALSYGQMCRLDGQHNTKVLVHQHAEIVRSEGARSRFHQSLWRLKFYPIFGLFRSSVFGETMGLTNNPEPDRILLAEVAMRGRFIQLPHITMFQRSSIRKSTWLWLNAGNRILPLANSLRSAKALTEALNRFKGIGLGTRHRHDGPSVCLVDLQPHSRQRTPAATSIPHRLGAWTTTRAD